MSAVDVELVKAQTQNQSKSHQKKKNKFDRNNRKRSKSFSGGGLGKIKHLKPVLPTKFLLGGNINDPLNLNSLQDEEINRAMNAVTPKSSPIPTPPRRKGQIEVIIPTNIHDPLHLIDCTDDAEYEQQLCSPVKKSRKKRLKKRRTASASYDPSEADAPTISEAKTPENKIDSAKVPEEGETSVVLPAEKCLDLDLSSKKRKSEEHKEVAKKTKFSFDKMDRIVSPVVPQPGAWLKRSNSTCRKQQTRPQKSASSEMPLFKEKDKQFQYGNYNRYYGYRNPKNEMDPRLRVFSHHPHLFKGKDVLDIGCNIGHITLHVARDYDAKSVTGIDIDDKLISIARKNVKHYIKNQSAVKTAKASDSKVHLKSSEFFPISLPILHGPIDIPGFKDENPGPDFPGNIKFKTCNYILEDDSLLALEQPNYDTILCLSVTKWIHLNWGDEGIKQAFRRMYAQLRPGGKLILEPQSWASYKRKRKLTEVIFKNFQAIEFFPDKFNEYLLSPAVGFAKSDTLAFPQHQSKGFRRPLQVFTKSTMFPSERTEAPSSSSVTPNVGVYNESLYQSIMKTQKYDVQPNMMPSDIKHVYTSLLYRYCGEDTFDAKDVELEQVGGDINNLKEDKKEVSCSVQQDVNDLNSRPESLPVTKH